MAAEDSRACPVIERKSIFYRRPQQKNSKGKTTEVAEFADASFCSSNGAGK
jgi:hypothetical protein